MNRAYEREKEKTQELTRLASLPDLSPEVQRFNPLSSMVVSQLRLSLGL